MAPSDETADLRFPIGRFEPPTRISPADRQRWIDDLAAHPEAARAAIRGLSAEQLDTPYRHGGWTVRQVLHHLPDSHLNGYLRMKLALTEPEPTITPYDQARWAELTDGRTAPVEWSLALLDGLHARWVFLLRSLDASAFARRFHHPESGIVPLDTALALYAWHGRHHLAQIAGLRERRGWSQGSDVV